MALVVLVLIIFNIVIPQVLWIREGAQNPTAVVPGFPRWFWSGMWLERFVIVVISLTPRLSAVFVGTLRATRWDYAIFLGTIGFFFVGDVHLRTTDADDHDL